MMTLPANYVYCGTSEWSTAPVNPMLLDDELARFDALVGKNIISTTYIYILTEVKVKLNKGKVYIHAVTDDYALTLPAGAIGINQLSPLVKVEEHKASGSENK